MTVRIFRSTDAGAPALTGQVGSLISVLDFCLPTLGWTKALSGTNLAGYKQPAGTNQFYLRVDDTGSVSGTPTVAKMCGMEVMSDFTSIATRFPSDAQMIGGVGVAKSRTADATARAWMLVSNGKMIYLWINNNTNINTGFLFAFGDIATYKPSDKYHTVIIGNADNTNTSIDSQYLSTSRTGLNAGHYIARSSAQIGSSTQVGKASDYAKSFGATTLGTNGPAFPSTVDGSLYMAPLFIQEVSGHVRGVLPGIWNICHVRPLADGDTLSGSGTLSGKTFEAKNLNTGQFLFETSDTW